MKKTYIEHLFSGFQNTFFTICVPLFSIYWSYHCIVDEPVSQEGIIFGSTFAPVVIFGYFFGMYRNWRGKSF